MEFTHLGHAAVLVQTPTARVLFDPGNMGEGWHAVTDLDAIVVTHQHADHLDPAAIGALIAANPQARMLVEPTVPDAVDAPLEGAVRFAAGSTETIGGLRVTAVGGEHAVIHRDIPLIGNVGVVLTAAGEPTFFHPGDALAAVPDGVDVVAVPAFGPWAALKETIDFTRAVGAGHGFCIHEALLAEPGFRLVDSRLDAMTDTTMHDLRSGEPLTL